MQTNNPFTPRADASVWRKRKFTTVHQRAQHKHTITNNRMRERQIQLMFLLRQVSSLIGHLGNAFVMQVQLLTLQVFPSGVYNSRYIMMYSFNSKNCCKHQAVALALLFGRRNLFTRPAILGVQISHCNAIGLGFKWSLQWKSFVFNLYVIHEVTSTFCWSVSNCVRLLNM